MRKESRLPKRIPAGSKYVLESRDGLVRRFVEFPDGRKLRLASRKAQSCDRLSVSLVPGLGDTETPKRIASARRRARALERA